MPEFGVLMKYIRFQQLSVGCWPLEEVDGIKNLYYKVFQWISAFLYTLKIVLEFSYICLHTGNVYALGKMFIIFLSGLLYQIRMMNIMFRMSKYSDVLVTFRDQISLLEFRKPTDFSKKQSCMLSLEGTLVPIRHNSMSHPEEMEKKGVSELLTPDGWDKNDKMKKTFYFVLILLHLLCKGFWAILTSVFIFSGRRFGLMFPLQDLSSKLMTVTEGHEKECKFMLSAFTIMFWGGHTLFYLISLFVNYKYGAFKKGSDVPRVLPLTLALPFDTKFNKVNWGIMFFVEYLYGFICLGSILYQDAMLCFFIIHSTGQLEILINNIQGLATLKEEPTNKNEKNIDKLNDYTANEKSWVAYSDADEANICGKLKDCVIHHQLIISFIDKVQTAFGIVIATNFFYNMLVICLLGFQLTATNIETVLQFGLFFVGAVVQLIVFCVSCDRFTNTSLQVAQELYCIDWPSMSPRTKSSIIFMLVRAQRPLHISALGFTNASIETMASILKTSFSYFTILKTLEE